MNTIGERIKKAREERRLSRPELAERSGVKYPTLAGIENGDQASSTRLHALAKALRVRVDWLATGTGSMETDASEAPDDGWRDIKGVQQAAALGDGSIPDEYAETHKLKFRAESLRRKHLRPDRLAVLYGRGDSMSPTIEDGDAILFDTSDTDLKDDRVYVVNYEGQLLAKRIVQIGDVWCISSDNTTDPKWKKPVPIDGVRGFQVLGRVRWVAGWLD